MGIVLRQKQRAMRAPELLPGVMGKASQHGDI